MRGRSDPNRRALAGEEIMGKGKAKDKHRDEKRDEAEAEAVAAKAASKKALKSSEKGAEKAGKSGKAPKAKREKSKVKAKPKGMRWIAPYLTVKDVDHSLAWYEKAFGFTTAFSLPGPDGKSMHAEMRHEKGVLMLGSETPDGRSRAPGKDGAGVSMYVYCRDVDALAASARAQGATIAEEPEDQFWGDRTCFLVDPDGHQWMFATHVFDMEDAEEYDDGPCGDEACGVCVDVDADDAAEAAAILAANAAEGKPAEAKAPAPAPAKAEAPAPAKADAAAPAPAKPEAPAKAAKPEPAKAEAAPKAAAKPEATKSGSSPAK